jgi:hypothetical protein
MVKGPRYKVKDTIVIPADQNILLDNSTGGNLKGKKSKRYKKGTKAFSALGSIFMSHLATTECSLATIFR